MLWCGETWETSPIQTHRRGQCIIPHCFAFQGLYGGPGQKSLQRHIAGGLQGYATGVCYRSSSPPFLFSDYNEHGQDSLFSSSLDLPYTHSLLHSQLSSWYALESSQSTIGSSLVEGSPNILTNPFSFVLPQKLHHALLFAFSSRTSMAQ